MYWQNIIYEDTKFCTNSHLVVAATVSGEAQGNFVDKKKLASSVGAIDISNLKN